LGGSAPRLQPLDLDYVPFSPIRKLLQSANDLVRLSLLRIEQKRVTPEEFATCLSSMAKLESISLAFKYYHHHPYPTGQHPSRTGLSCAILPALTYFGLKGAGGYLEDLMDRVDAPLLDGITAL